MGGIQTSTGVFEYYRYPPSIPAASIFVALFFLTAALHTYQFTRTRAWTVLPLVLGGYGESIGYIGRILSSKESPNFAMGPFLLANLLTILAPALFAASIYMSLGRIILATKGQALSLIRPSHLTTLFVSCDIVGLAIQGAGSSVMPAGTLADFYIGEKIVIAGLAVLVTSIGLFILVALIFDFRMRKEPTECSISSGLNWKMDLGALYLGSALIFVRSIFRLVEYSQGNSGWLLTHEWTLYVFDSVPMLTVMVLFNLVHPSHVQALLQGGKYSEKAGLRIVDIQKEELDGPEKA